MAIVLPFRKSSMSQAVLVSQPAPSQEVVKRKGIDFAALEKVLVSGDIADMTKVQRLQYLALVCESVGLNPMTRPFDILKFNGKEILYANKSCAEQLRDLHGVSTRVISREIVDGICTVVMRAKDSTGREDEDLGCVTVGHLKGDALGNAIMKTMTKAKRRVTLSICGLGVLDETETETMQGAQPLNLSYDQESIKAAKLEVARAAIVPPTVAGPIEKPTREQLTELSANAKTIFKVKSRWEAAFSEKFPGKKMTDISLAEYAIAVDWIHELYFLQCENG